MNRLCLIAAIGVFTLGFGVNVQAQDTQPESQQTLLPEIDPQDIEIRSQFQARFPGLRRQPILGFNPRPRVYQIDPNRIPFIEDEETVVANLPIGTLDRPEPPRYTPLEYADPQNGFARFGIGSFLSPEADLYAIARLNEKNRLSASFNHFSTEGHLEDFTDSYRNSDLDLRSIHMISRSTTVKLNAGVRSSFNHYPGLVTEFGEPTGENSRVDMFGFNTGATIDWAKTSLSGFKIAVDGYANQFVLESDLSTLGGDAREWGFGGEVQYSRLGENIQEVHRVKVQSASGGTELIDSPHQGWTVSKISAHYERLFNYQTDVKASLGAAGATDAVNDFTFYLAPEVTITHNLFSGVDLKAHLSGTPSHREWSRVYAENPFLDFRDQLQHQFEWLGYAEAKIEPVSGTAINGGVSYQNIKNYLYYTQNENLQGFPGSTERYYSVAFDNANIFKLYGGFSQDLKPEVIWIRVDGAWQRPRLSNDEKIPFIESFSLKGTVAMRPFKQLVVEGWGEYVGTRLNSEGNSLSPFVMLGGRFEISLHERLGVYGKLINLLDEEYELWQGYPERGFQGYIGITYLF